MIARPGDLVQPGRIAHLEVEAEDRDEARDIAAQIIADALAQLFPSATWPRWSPLKP